MSCFAVSKLTGKCGGSPAKKTGSDDSPGKGTTYANTSATGRCSGPSFSPGQQPKKKSGFKSSGLADIEIFQEVPSVSVSVSSRYGIPGSPVPPSTPNLQLRRLETTMQPATSQQFQFYSSAASYQPQHSVSVFPNISAF